MKTVKKIFEWLMASIALMLLIMFVVDPSLIFVENGSPAVKILFYLTTGYGAFVVLWGLWIWFNDLRDQVATHGINRQKLTKRVLGQILWLLLGALCVFVALTTIMSII